MGIQRGKIRRQRWGIEIPEVQPRTSRTGKPNILWTGFIPHVRQKEFKVAWQAADALRASDNSVNFQFLFKPTSWKDEFASYARPGIEVGVSTKPFKSALMEADALFTPLGENAILTPPLSWLEAMALEVPVITTNTFGIGELIRDGENGFVRQSGESLGDTVARAAGSDLVTIGRNARTKVSDEFRLDQCVQDMYDLWSELNDQRISS